MITYESGDYDAEIVDQGYGLSEPGQTPYWAITCWLLGRRGADGRATPCPGQRLTLRFPLRPGESTAVDEALAALGLTADQIDTTSPTFTPLKGRRVVLRCRHRMTDGRTQEEWRLAETTPLPAAAGGTSPTFN